MQRIIRNCQRSLLLSALVCAGAPLPRANAATCTTQAQMTAVDRDGIASGARSILAQVQQGDMQALRANTLPAVAADFGGIAASVTALQPLVQRAAITVDNLYGLDASTEPAGATQTDFYCGSPVVTLNFSGLPPGTYALAIVHATGVEKPQQVALILAKTAEGRWMLAGFFSKPMIEDGHDGLWYWVSARKYTQLKMNWNAWFYYRLAAELLDPVEFLSSPNLDKLHHEADEVHPADLPESGPVTIDAHGSTFKIAAIETTSALGSLDLDVHYLPDTSQAQQLRDPMAARGQMIGLMTALLEQHPQLRSAFHGIWVHADQGNTSIFALEVPMSGIGPGSQPATNSTRTSQ
jgi:hypothetical protein